MSSTWKTLRLQNNLRKEGHRKVPTTTTTTRTTKRSRGVALLEATISLISGQDDYKNKDLRSRSKRRSWNWFWFWLLVCILYCVSQSILSRGGGTRMRCAGFSQWTRTTNRSDKTIARVLFCTAISHRQEWNRVESQSHHHRLMQRKCEMEQHQK